MSKNFGKVPSKGAKVRQMEEKERKGRNHHKTGASIPHWVDADDDLETDINIPQEDTTDD